MITEFSIGKYGVFEDFKVTGLRRINLIVGKNGIGKTLLLEALRTDFQHNLLSHEIPVASFNSHILDMLSLEREWIKNRTSYLENKVLIIEALQIIDQNVKDFECGRWPRVSFFNNDYTRNIYDIGHGMVKIFQLSLKLIEAKNGVLLIDEIENSLHYSVQGILWGFLFFQAERLNVQIFATTHSIDCIKSLNYSTQGNNAMVFRLGRNIITGKIMAAQYTIKELSNEIEMDMDIR